MFQPLISYLKKDLYIFLQILLNNDTAQLKKIAPPILVLLALGGIIFFESWTISGVFSSIPFALAILVAVKIGNYYIDPYGDEIITATFTDWLYFLGSVVGGIILFIYILKVLTVNFFTVLLALVAVVILHSLLRYTFSREDAMEKIDNQIAETLDPYQYKIDLIASIVEKSSTNETQDDSEINKLKGELASLQEKIDETLPDWFEEVRTHAGNTIETKRIAYLECYAERGKKPTKAIFDKWYGKNYPAHGGGLMS